MLALLALSPTRSRSRAWIQDKLWSDRAPEQGSASLRQALSVIRKRLGEYRDCLQTDLRGVSLASDRVDIDLDALDLAALAAERRHDPPRLLDDLDPRDPEFEDWLRDQRHAFDEELDSLGRGGSLVPVGQTVAVSPSIIGPDRMPRPWVRVLESQNSSGDSGAFIAHLVSQTVARGIAERGAVDLRETPGEMPGIELVVDAMPLPHNTCVLITLVSAHSRVQLWSGSQTIPNDTGFLIDSPRLQRLINQAIDIAAHHLSNLLTDAPGASATANALTAVQKMFRLDRAELDAADELLRQAFELDPKGIFLAWRAYARTFYVGEQGAVQNQALKEEAEALARKAIELAPYDSTVLALASYVQSFLLHNYVAGHELADQSLKYNPANALGHAFLGRAKSYMGEHEEGYRLTARARAISGPAPFQYTLDFLCGITALLSGRFDEAIQLGEIARSLAPTYRPPQRYLVPLYLQMGEPAKAREVLESLRKMEPDFSVDAMREKSYPSAGLRDTGLLDIGDSDL